MSSARIIAVAPGSPAARAGLAIGDELIAVNGERLRDVLQYRLLTDAANPEFDIVRGGLDMAFEVRKWAGEPIGIEVESAVFDRIRTCDNHCEFCFIYQLPPGMRKSLYLKDDDYRLSFLYGNFTTLTRFTEADLERVLTEHLSPLHVSIHATDRAIRSRMLRNRRGATSLRWLRALLDAEITVHGQVVVCPGINDGDVLDDTLCGVLDEYPELASVAVVPLGISQFNNEAAMRPHTIAEAEQVVDLVHDWQDVFCRTLGRPLVFAGDEYYLLAKRPMPPAEMYGDFEMYEDGVGMATLFSQEFLGMREEGSGIESGFFAWVDGAPAEGYRAPKTIPAVPTNVVKLRPRRNAPVGVLSGEYGAQVIEPLISTLERSDVRVIPVRNDYFGGTTAVTGLLTGSDLQRVLSDEPLGHRYLLPDVCLSQGRFLDGLTPADLPRPVEVIATDGSALRRALLKEIS